MTTPSQQYKKVQLKTGKTKRSSLKGQVKFEKNWKKKDIADLQRQVVDLELSQLYQGSPNRTYKAYLNALKKIPLKIFSLLDAACASGYYYEITKASDKRNIDYHGCDYSTAMIKLAQKKYPKIDFKTQDITKLRYKKDSFDVVLLSGVLEHIPRWRKAIEKVCRVAKHYVIVHRAKITNKPHIMYTIGYQYSIKTPRNYFPLSTLKKEFAKHGYLLNSKVNIYNRSLTQKIQQLFSPKSAKETTTLIFSKNV